MGRVDETNETWNRAGHGERGRIEMHHENHPMGNIPVYGGFVCPDRQTLNEVAIPMQALSMP